MFSWGNITPQLLRLHGDMMHVQLFLELGALTSARGAGELAYRVGSGGSCP